MKIGKIVLAGHSGGGTPMLRQIELMQRTPIREVWAFEAIYVGTNSWVNAVTSNTDTQFFFHYATVAQRDRAQEILTKLKGTTFDLDTARPIGIDGKRYPKQEVTKANYIDLMGGKLNASFVENPTVPKVGGDHYGALTKNFADRIDAAKWMK